MTYTLDHVISKCFGKRVNLLTLGSSDTTSALEDNEVQSFKQDPDMHDKLSNGDCTDCK